MTARYTTQSTSQIGRLVRAEITIFTNFILEIAVYSVPTIASDELFEPSASNEKME